MHYKIFGSLLTVMFLRRWNLIVSRSCTGILRALIVGGALTRLPIALKANRSRTCLLWALIVLRPCSCFLWALIVGKVYAGFLWHVAPTLVHYSAVQFPLCFFNKTTVFQWSWKIDIKCFYNFKKWILGTFHAKRRNELLPNPAGHYCATA